MLDSKKDWSNLPIRQRYKIVYLAVADLQPDASFQSIWNLVRAAYPNANKNWVGRSLKRFVMLDTFSIDLRNVEDEESKKIYQKKFYYVTGKFSAI